MGDPARLAQMLDNLLHNAVKFTDAGGRLTVHLDEILDVGRPAAVSLRVRDTGIGMDDETLTRLFEPFVQADRSLNRSRGGLGLGLALVKTLAELHGGTIAARSPGLGRGSEVTLRLPRLVGPAPAPSSAAAEAEAPSRRILVIEDNLDSALTLKLVLKRRGHDVVVAHTGAKGLEHALARVPEVVLCDIGLPGELDGYAVARALRADPRTAKVFLVALTGYGQEEDRRLTAEAGFDEHLVKPMAWSVLGALLARLG
jgi:CheY-like chemotaxis protein